MMASLPRLSLFTNLVKASWTTSSPSLSALQNVPVPVPSHMNQPQSRSFHVNQCLCEVRKLTRVRCVDNSAIGKQAMAEGKPPKVIHIYNKTSVGTIGDKVLVTIKGEMKKGILVGVKQIQKHGVPKHDTNNVVLIDDNGTPLGTRINAPIPMVLRRILKEKTFSKGADYTKVLSIASRFI